MVVIYPTDWMIALSIASDGGFIEVQAQVTYDAASGLWLVAPDWTAKHEIIEWYG